MEATYRVYGSTLEPENFRSVAEGIDITLGVSWSTIGILRGAAYPASEQQTSGARPYYYSAQVRSYVLTLKHYQSMELGIVPSMRYGDSASLLPMARTSLEKRSDAGYIGHVRALTRWYNEVGTKRPFQIMILVTVSINTCVTVPLPA
jgi:hypothetical protein